MKEKKKNVGALLPFQVFYTLPRLSLPDNFLLSLRLIEVQAQLKCMHLTR